MIKKTVKYEEFNGDMQEKKLYFNITKTEATEMSVSERGGLDKVLIKIRDAKDEKEIYKHFKRIMLKAYGEKSADGRRFNKSEQMRADFENSAAFDALMSDIMWREDIESVTAFIEGIFPSKKEIENLKSKHPALKK